jgi:hypothetical protein
LVGAYLRHHVANGPGKTETAKERQLFGRMASIVSANAT